MISIIVQRPPADNQGPDISNPLIGTESQAIGAATAEIDKHSTDRVEVSGVIPLNPYMKPGLVVLVTDLQRGQYRAMIISFSVTISREADGGFTATSNIVLEREREHGTGN